MTIASCSDDEFSGDYTSYGEFTPGGKFSAKGGSVYLTMIDADFLDSYYAYYQSFSYTDGELSSAGAKDIDGDGMGLWGTITVTHDPLLFNGWRGFLLTDIEQNSDGFITSLTNIDDYYTITYDFSYDSSGHLTYFKEEGVSGTSVEYEWTLTWDSDKITEITRNSSSSTLTTLTLSSFEYSSKYPNVTLQYGTYVERIFGDLAEDEGFSMLFYLGYLGKASSYHPISFTCTYEFTSENYTEEEEYFYYYKPTLNKDGSLKKMKVTEDWSNSSYSGSQHYTYTFSYE